jgi:antirestriction protein ArdC
MAIATIHHNHARTKRDIYQEITAQILAELEAGAAPWIKPWSATPGRNTPCNAVTNRPYSGCNVVQCDGLPDRVMTLGEIKARNPDMRDVVLADEFLSASGEGIRR